MSTDDLSPLATPPSAPATKCPMCLEAVPAGASKCGHCGYFQDPELRSREAAARRQTILSRAPGVPPAPDRQDRIMYVVLGLVWPLAALGSLIFMLLGAVGVICLIMCLLAGHGKRATGYALALLFGFGLWIAMAIAVYS